MTSLATQFHFAITCISLKRNGTLLLWEWNRIQRMQGEDFTTVWNLKKLQSNLSYGHLASAHNEIFKNISCFPYIWLLTRKHTCIKTFKLRRRYTVFKVFLLFCLALLACFWFTAIMYIFLLSYAIWKVSSLFFEIIAVYDLHFCLEQDATERTLRRRGCGTN